MQILKKLNAWIRKKKYKIIFTYTILLEISIIFYIIPLSYCYGLHLDHSPNLIQSWLKLNLAFAIGLLSSVVAGGVSVAPTRAELTYSVRVGRRCVSLSLLCLWLLFVVAMNGIPAMPSSLQQTEYALKSSRTKK